MQPEEQQLALGGEPVAIINLIVIALTAIQAAVLPIPTWATILISCFIIGGGAILSRAKVTPILVAAGRKSGRKSGFGRKSG